MIVINDNEKPIEVAEKIIMGKRENVSLFGGRVNMFGANELIELGKYLQIWGEAHKPIDDVGGGF